MTKLSSSRTKYVAVSKDNRTDGLANRKSIISRLKDLFWKLLNRPIKCCIFVQEVCTYCFNRIGMAVSNALGRRFPEGSTKCEVMTQWRGTCSKFGCSATEDRLKAMDRDGGVKNRVNALVANMNSNMRRVEYMEVVLKKNVLPRDPFKQSSAVMTLSPVIFETMLHRIENGDVIDEALLKEADSFMNSFNRLLEAVENLNDKEASLFSLAMWGRVALHAFKNVALVDDDKKHVFDLFCYRELEAFSLPNIDEATADKASKEDRRFIYLLQSWFNIYATECGPYLDNVIILKLREYGIPNIPGSWNTDDLICTLIMNKLDETKCFDPDQGAASFYESFKKWVDFTAQIQECNRIDRQESLDSILSLLEPYINPDTKKLGFDNVVSAPGLSRVKYYKFSLQ